MLQMSRVQLVHVCNRIDSPRFTAFAGSLEDRGLGVGGPRALQNLRCSSPIGEGEDRGGRTEKDDSGQKLEPPKYQPMTRNALFRLRRRFTRLTWLLMSDRRTIDRNSPARGSYSDTIRNPRESLYVCFVTVIIDSRL